jgi:serine/threonine-protein kinase
MLSSMVDHPTETRQVPVPKQLIGDFEVVKELGRGSMGVVYEALQHPLERRVALKTFTAEGRTEQALERFKREASAAAKLTHPGIVPVWAVGEDRGTHYYAMQLVEGKTLRDWIYEGKIDARRAATLAKKIAEALEYAHGQGVIHRDLKPANIIITGDEQPVITDFGLAKNLALTKMTQVGAVLGTPTHMSPEQAKGSADVDHRCDIYGIGAVLYEMLTARLPFYAENINDILKKVIEEAPAPPRSVKPETPPELEAITLKCLAKDREARYQSAGEVAKELDRYLRGEKLASTRLPRAGGGGGGGGFGRVVRGLVKLVLLLALLAGAAVGGAVAWQRGLAEPVLARLGISLGAAGASASGAGGGVAKSADGRAAEAQRWAERGVEAQLRSEKLAGAEAERARDAALEAFAAALALDTSNAEAEAGIGGIWLRRARDADARGEADRAALCLAEVKKHNPKGLFDPALKAEGTLVVHVKPAGAAIAVDRVIPIDTTGETRRERLFEGSDPLAQRVLAAGSYVLEVSAQGFATAIVPIAIDRLAREELTVRLLAPADIPKGFVYVPAGPFRSGGDPKAIRARPRARIDLPGFLIAEREVTCGEFAEFLASLPPAEARRAAPRGGARHGHAALFWPEGKAWHFPPAWPAERPVMGVTYETALKYAIWRGAKDGRGPYRLPTELEWEKACRGADGRSYPWGEADPAGRANVPVDGRPVEPRPVGMTDGDVSIYGVRDMIGNASEWTSSNLDARLTHRIVRGGAYVPFADEPRAAARFPIDAEDPPEHVGIRLAYDLPE